MDDSRPDHLIRVTRASGPEDAPEPVDLGARVRELRKAQGWTLEQAAQRAGLARSTLSKIENGQMSPTYHALRKLAYVLTGVIRLYTEFYEPLEMRRGDSAYYDATMGHNVISLSAEDATVLWVTSLH